MTFDHIVLYVGIDTSICNGVVPHPFLPVVASYGISYVAKVWTWASTPENTKSCTQGENANNRNYVQLFFERRRNRGQRRQSDRPSLPPAWFGSEFPNNNMQSRSLIKELSCLLECTTEAVRSLLLL